MPWREVVREIKKYMFKDWPLEGGLSTVERMAKRREQRRIASALAGPVGAGPAAEPDGPQPHRDEVPAHGDLLRGKLRP
eukprot:6527182-Pyramimonas_sp.AAC.1